METHSLRAILSLLTTLFIVSFIIIFFAENTQAAPCHAITNSSQTPSGYASPVSYFTNSLMVRGDCNNGSIGVSVGNGSNLTYIYNTSYSWNGSSWQPVTLNGSNPQGPWIPGAASGQYSSTDNPSWYVAYTCEWIANAWKCGCTTQACTQNQWQVQAMVPPPPPSPPSGGGTSGGGGNTGGGERVILDTDFSGDVDDVGTVAVLNELHNRGELQMLAVMSVGWSRYAVPGINAINTYYGNGNVPVGRHVQGANNNTGTYAKYIADRHPHSQTYDSAKPADQLYREVLSSQPDNSVVVVTVGQLRNLRKVMENPSDRDLFNRKVKRVHIMGGEYPRAGGQIEANFRGNGDAKITIDNITKPIIFNGFEVGAQFNGYSTGSNLNNLPNNSPVKDGYLFFFRNPPWSGIPVSNTIQDWSIWDQIALIYAIRPNSNHFGEVTTGYNSVANDGRNEWRSSPDKNHTYLTRKMDPNTYADTVVEPLMMAMTGVGGSSGGGSTGGSSSGGGSTGGGGSSAGQGLIWSDEFNGTSLDFATPSNPRGLWRPNDQWQSLSSPGYEDFAGNSWNINPNHPAMSDFNPFSVQNGALRITMRRTPDAIRSTIQSAHGSVPTWSGGMLILNPDVRRIKYGYIEWRARFPVQGRGMFPALWMYASDGGQANRDGKGGSEIDVLEIFGQPNVWYTTLHRLNNSLQGDRTSFGASSEDTQGWHTYAVDWQPNYIRIYRDGVLRHEETGSKAQWYSTEMGIRMNFSMDGSWFAGQNTQSNSTTPSPMYMEVDYVRVYSQKP